MKYGLCFFLLIIFACNAVKNENNQSHSMQESQIDKRSVSDSVIVKTIISKCISNYMKDTSIAKYSETIKLLTVEFFCENRDTILSISGHSVLPVISPQNMQDGYEFKGFLFFNKTPVLFYDNERALGYGFYDVSKLITDSLKLDEAPANRIGFPRWMYKVNNGCRIELLKKTPEFRFK